MKKTSLAAAFTALILAAGYPAPAQTLSDLLQKGIYTQETVGDLDGAIKIYRQIVATAKDAHNYAAQAQYRLGLCLLKKGDHAEAVKAFQQVIKDFPEQTDLVAKAREYASSDLKLLPAPWTDGEVQEVKLHLQAGLYVGTIYYSIDAAASGGNTELVQSRTYTGNFGVQSYSSVEVDRDAMQPVRSTFRHSMLGQFDVQYQAKQAQVTTKGKEGVKTVELDGPTYDNEEWVYLIRRLPLAPGFKTTIADLAPGGTFIKLAVQVIAEEDVQVPAGKFHCYKLEIPLLKQAFWIAADGPRNIVKFEANSVVGELNSVRRADASAPIVFQHGRLGFSLTAPAGWAFDEGEKTTGGDVSLLDPGVIACTRLTVSEIQKDNSAAESKLRESADDTLKDRPKTLQNFKLRSEGVQPRQVGGRPGVSYIAEYTDQGRKMVEYHTWVRGESTEAHFSANVEASDFDGFRAKLDSIIESLKLR